MKAMATKTLRSLLSCTSGAVAPTVALSLVGLIAAGGLAFDYSRLVGMHSELQNAADQAALAAASQLDGKTGATQRAEVAAANLVANSTLISNDAGTPGVGIATVTFYQDKAKTLVVTRDDASTTDDRLAHYVEVTVDGREVFYALTPIVGAMNSDNIDATAMAGLESAICKVPPVMMCNPNEPGSTDFDGDALRGVGLLLITGDASAPGNFGYLDTDAVTGNGTPELKTLIGYDSPPGDCSPTDKVDLKTGMRPEVMDALNTRFDIYDSQNCPQPTGLSGTCSPSSVSRKDLVRNNQCGTGGQGWGPSPSPYRPSTPGPLTSGYPDIMGYPRDYCHAVTQDSQTCDHVGTGDWDRDAYFRVNYGWTSTAAWASATSLSSNATRYDVYEWERDHPSVSTPLGMRGIGVNQAVGTKTAYGQPVCNPPGITPSGTTVDRRRISVAVINCEALNLNGAENGVTVNKWVDVFLVEPSVNRGSGTNVFTERKEVYVEVIGETGQGAGITFGQVIQRKVPYLVE
jgi:Flp pilus assembly protein TadG